MALRAVRDILPRSKFPKALRLSLINKIPIGRGLGSSAAARLGGLMAAYALIKNPSPLGGEGRVTGTDSLLEAACRLEGHPDNVVAAFHGGLCLAVETNGRTSTVALKVPRGLGAVVCVPDFELSTEKARNVLPKKILRQDAVQTSARTALLIAAIEQGKFGWLKSAMQDVLHQPYRAKLVPGMGDVISAAVRAGAYGAALSGAGPSIFAFCPGARGSAAIGLAMKKAFARKGVSSRSLTLEIDRQGAVVEILE
jgi:homoserine kinase